MNNLKLLAVVIGLAVLGVAGYFVFGGGGSSLITGGGKLDPVCEYNDPDLCKFLNNALADEEFSMRAVSSGGGQPPYETLMDISGDSSRMVVKEGSRETWNQISIDKTVYSKDFKDGKWWKYTYKDEAEAEENPFDTDDFDFTERLGGEQKIKYTAAGKEACGSLTCFKYRAVTPGFSDEEYVLFDDKQYKLRVTRSKSRDGMTTETTYTYGGVSIRAPSPTKEASSLIDLYSF